MATALTIINGALRLLQVKSPDVVLTDDEAQDALESFNQMLSAWSNESLMLYHIVKETFTCTAGLNPHTIGTGGTFNTNRPIDIEAITVQVANGVDFGVQKMAYDDYSSILLKTLTTNYPTYFYLDQTYPLASLFLYPVPSSAISITLYSRKPFSSFVNLTDAISLPPGYERAMKYCLACELAPEYQTTAGQDILNLAIGAKASLKRTNHRELTYQTDISFLSSTRPRFNVYRGQ